MLANYITKSTPITNIQNLQLANPKQVIKELKIDQKTIVEKIIGIN